MMRNSSLFFLMSLMLSVVTLPASGNPQYDHVVVVVEENHGFEQIIGSANAPYLNKLAQEGVLITNAYSEQHPSQPNYFWLFSGSNQGINDDNPYWPPNPPGPIFSAPNLYTALEQKFAGSFPNFFGGYVDSGTSAPPNGYYQDTANYANRHVPWLGFKNINGGNPAGITQVFAKTFPKEKKAYANLPKVSFIIPALNHDMHDYDGSGGGVGNPQQSEEAVRHGDKWLKANLSGYAEWAKKNNSLLIITWDEDSTSDWPTPCNQNGGGPNGGQNPAGLTAPNLQFNPTCNGGCTSGPNRIAMIFYGANLAKAGPYKLSGVGANNINLLRTIESFYGLAKSGAQTPVAVAAGLNDEPITEIFRQAHDVQAGPIWNEADAKRICPGVCKKAHGRWNGQWTTTQPRKMSVCGCMVSGQ